MTKNNVKIELDSKALNELSPLFPSTPILYSGNGDVWGNWGTKGWLAPGTSPIPMYIDNISTQYSIIIDCAKLLRLIENSYCSFNLDNLTQYVRYNTEGMGLKTIPSSGVMIWSVCVHSFVSLGSIGFFATPEGVKFGIFNESTKTALVEPLTFSGKTLREVLTSNTTLSLITDKNLGLVIWQTYDNSNILLSDSPDELIASDCYVAIKDTGHPISE